MIFKMINLIKKLDNCLF